MAIAKITFQDLITGLQSDTGPRQFAEYFYYDRNDFKVRWPTDRIKIREDLVDTPRFLDFEIMSQYDWLCGIVKKLNRHPRFGIIAGHSDYKGPKVISEGDSWQLYPLVLKEIVDHLLWPTEPNPVAVWSTDCAADTLEHIWRHRKDKGEYWYELAYGAQPPPYTFMFLSGGGNDLLNSGRLYTMLNDYTAGMTAQQLINKAVAEAEGAKIMALFDLILWEMEVDFPNVQVVTHGYDYPVSQDDVWIGKPLQKRGINDRPLQREVIKVFMDLYNDQLVRTVNAHLKNTIYVDLRGTVPDEMDWHDEIHPTSAGFAAIAKKIREAIGVKAVA